jgi:hypothetical protein
MHSFKTGYADAIARHNPHVLGGTVAKSKLKGELQTTKPVPRLNVAVSPAFHYFSLHFGYLLCMPRLLLFRTEIHRL